jgi:hypothetical protein
MMNDIRDGARPFAASESRVSIVAPLYTKTLKNRPIFQKLLCLDPLPSLSSRCPVTPLPSFFWGTMPAGSAKDSETLSVTAVA